jgi:hypothetical protein
MTTTTTMKKERPGPIHSMQTLVNWANEQPPLMEPKFSDVTFDFYYNLMDTEKMYPIVDTCMDNCLTSDCQMEFDKWLRKEYPNLHHLAVQIIASDLKHVVIKAIYDMIDERKKGSGDIIRDQINTLRFKRTAQTCSPFGFI